LREGLIHSQNLVSVRLLQAIGIPNAIEYIKRFGFDTTKLPRDLSLALGSNAESPMTLVSAYAVFANGGYKVHPYLVDHIFNVKDDLIYQAHAVTACPECEVATNTPLDIHPAPRVITAQNAYLITSAMKDVIRRGTGKLARILNRSDIAGKTGTTNNQVDAWFAGFNGDVVAVSWLGFDSPQSLHEYGSRAALPMWIQFMKATLKGKPENTITQPPGIVTARINLKTGKRTSTVDNSMFEIFRENNVPAYGDVTDHNTDVTTQSALIYNDDSDDDDSQDGSLY
jgi:penicillin-binding protein 1A